MPATHDVEVKESRISGAGRGLFAMKDFQPGDVVLAIDRPLVAELDIARLKDSCAWCFQRAATDPMERAHAVSIGSPSGYIEVKACTGCHRISYCSKGCQSKAWKKEHKYECKILAPKERPDLPDGVRAAIKLLGRYKTDSSKTDRESSIFSFRPFNNGRGLEQFSKDNKKLSEDLGYLGYAAWKYSGEPKLENTDAQTAAKAFVFGVMCNKFGLNAPLDDTLLGIGFDPLVSSANHSCEPNVSLVFNQPAVVLRAMQPIKKGEEIFMRYIDVTNPFSVRQEELKETYYFTCQCPKCVKGAAFLEDKFSIPPQDLAAKYCELADKLIRRHEQNLSKFLLPVSDETAQRRLAALQAEAFSVSGTITDAREPELNEIKDALRMCIDSGLWKWTRQPVPHLCRHLFAKYIENGDPYRAFRLGCKMYFEIIPAISPQLFDSERLIHTWAMSTVTNVLCGPMYEKIYKEFMQSGLDLRIAYYGFLFDAYDNVPKMYGLDSPFGMVVENTYKQIMAGTKVHETEIRDKIKELWPSLETVARSVGVDGL